MKAILQCKSITYPTEDKVFILHDTSKQLDSVILPTGPGTKIQVNAVRMHGLHEIYNTTYGHRFPIASIHPSYHI